MSSHTAAEPAAAVAYHGMAHNRHIVARATTASSRNRAVGE